MEDNILCSKCKESKSPTYFYTSKTNKRGFSSRCIECTKLVAKEWKNRNREKVLARRREIYQIDKDKIEKQNRLWEVRNKEKVFLSQKLWKQKNKEKTKQYKYTRRARRARRVENGGVILGDEIKLLFLFYNHSCLACGKTQAEITLSLDHVVPLALGGKNTIDNSQPLCKICNSKKGLKTIDYRTKQQISDFQNFIQQKKAMD